jgi:transcriptional regulator with GAF, ATPase, and Fis domain
MSREAFAGAPEPRTDLYALGATLYHVASGAPPHPGDDVAAVARAVADGRAAPVRDRAPWLPAPLAALIDRLLAPRPGDRPSSARVVADELARLREALDLPARETGPVSAARPLLTPPMIGRDALLAALDQAFDDRDRALVRLLGPAGVGRRSLLGEAIRRRQLAAAAERAPAVDVIWGDPDDLARSLGDRAGGGAPRVADRARAVGQFTDRLLALAERAAAGRADDRRIILVVDAAADDERAVAVERAAAAGHPVTRSGRVLIVRPVDAEVGAAPSAGDLVVAPLSEAEVGELVAAAVGRPVAGDWVARLAEVSGGLPRLVMEAVRAAGDAVGKVDPGELFGAGDRRFDDLVVRRVAGLEPAASQLVEALAVLGGSATSPALAAVVGRGDDDLAAALDLVAPIGLVRWRSGELALPSAAHARAIAGALPAARSKALHRRAVAWLDDRGAGAVELAPHLVVTGPAARAVAAAREAARELAGRGLVRRAHELLSRAADQASGAAVAEVGVELAELEIELGDYSAAIDHAGAAARARRAGVKRRARLAAARAHKKAGDSDAAERALARLRDSHPTDPEVAAAYASLLIGRGRWSEAAELAGEPATTGPLGPGDAGLLEAAGLAALYQGDSDGARRWFAALERRARTSGDDARVGRAVGLQGMAAQITGDVASAATLYERAAAAARAVSDLHAAAVHELNRAGAHASRGRHGAALDALGAAMVELRRLGDVPELAAAQYNRGVALLSLGEVEAARRAAERAQEIAERHHNPTVETYARLLAGDVERRLGHIDRAVAAYRDAIGFADRAGSERDRLLGRANLAEALALAGDPAAAGELDGAAADARSADDRDRLVLSRARVALALGDALPAGAEPDDGELDESRRRLRATGRTDLAWRADFLAARIARAAGDDDRARRRVEEARAIYAELLAELPEARRAGFASDPDAAALAALADELADRPAAAVDDGAAPSGRRLRQLLALSRRLNSELRLAPLLDQVIDTAIELTSAERGFLLLFRPGSDRDLDVVVARNFAQSALDRSELQLSRSIAERAARTGEVVLTVDAAFDERFGAAESVAAMRLRSVLAVPLRQKGRVTGTIYVDHRFRSAAFDDEAIELVRELADIAAVAIENARLVEENRARQREIDELNRRLSDEVVEKEAELANVKARLAATDRDGLRHAYDAIVGRSTAIVDMLELVDRATDTQLPVVITGESGTGKELVARALHENGPRREQAFVAINCGAVPESLLESELFGHVRGAFTGADRDRRGMFEVADGGTLFLDEVADTSLAMQAKLLRVLQESEIRRVGDGRTRKVDVRVVAATNKPLDPLVASGSFREDLFYRLSVLTIRVPPLRERIEDLPAIADHILRRAHADPPAIDKGAMARLTNYPWPGNVRELENELARASALASGTIGPDDLSSRIATAPAAPPGRDPDDLAIKPRVEALERSLVDEALKRTGGNQTAAAKLLGLSRYGLQKKLKRYGIHGSV